MKRVAGAFVMIFQSVQRRHVGIAVLVGIVEAVEQSGPDADLGLGGERRELVLVGVTGVKRLQVMSRRIDEDGTRPREPGQEQGVGARPSL